MANDETDVLQKKPAHPITTMLLMVASAALIFGIWLTSQELARYVNPKTRQELNQFQTSPLTLTTRAFVSDMDTLLDRREREDRALTEALSFNDEELASELGGSGLTPEATE